MESISSPDGTRLAYHRRGSGPPLVVVHGSGAANPVAWLGVMPALEAHFTVYALDRRGRGQSGDSADYALAREAEDIAAVVAASGEPAHLLGHSFGALCALEAALLTDQVRKLILYEPALPLPGVPLYAPGLVERLEALLAAGDREGVLAVVFREIVGMPEAEFEQLRASAAWPSRLASAHTLPRETRAEVSYVFDAQRLSALKTPTLLLQGGDSPALLTQATELLHTALPNSRIVVLPGQQHLAMYTAPALLAREVLAFLREAGG